MAIFYLFDVKSLGGAAGDDAQAALSRPQALVEWVDARIGADISQQDREVPRVGLDRNNLGIGEEMPEAQGLVADVRAYVDVIKFIGLSPEPRRIVGVVPDIDDENIIPSPTIMIYQPVDQEGWQGRLFVRTEHDPYALVPAITRTVHEMDADQPVERASTLEDIRAEVLTPDRLNAIVFGGFAAVALSISVVGVAGVLAFSVSSRTREFGIRMALGAQPRGILTSVLSEGLVIATIGVGAGMLLGIALARAIGRYVIEVQLPGLLSFTASGVVILAAAAIAAAVPAARAAKVNPVEALRSE